MSEIVVADPIIDPGAAGGGRDRGVETRDDGVTRCLTYDHGGASCNSSNIGPEPFDSERLPPTLAPEIQRFLRVANLIESEEPRIAYLCRFNALEIVHNMDRNSTGKGVRQFRTSLLQRLEQDEEPTYRRMKERSDIRELMRVYRAYKDYILKSRAGFDLDDRHTEKLINACRIASVLYEVLKTVTNATGTQKEAGEMVNRRSSGRVRWSTHHHQAVFLPVASGDVLEGEDCLGDLAVPELLENVEPCVSSAEVESDLGEVEIGVGVGELDLGDVELEAAGVSESEFVEDTHATLSDGGGGSTKPGGHLQGNHLDTSGGTPSGRGRGRP